MRPSAAVPQAGRWAATCLAACLAARLAAAAALEPDWAVRAAAGDLLYTESEATVKYHATVGNGAIGVDTDPSNQHLFLAGVFNGYDAAGSEGGRRVLSHRAAVPNPLSLGLQGPWNAGAAAALDLRRAQFLRRRRGRQQEVDVTLEQRLYAHRTRPALLVVELNATWSGGPEHLPVSFEPRPLGAAASPDFDPASASTAPLRQPPDAAAAPPEAPAASPAPRFAAAWRGRTKAVEAGAAAVEVAVAAWTPARLSMRRGQKYVLLAAFRSSLDAEVPLQAAVRDLQAALDQWREDGCAEPERLCRLSEEHEQAWAGLWENGFEVEGRLDVQQAARSSMYYILSSLREDRPFSLSPGGLASNGYNGHTFWDTETWMFPPVLAWHPRLARSLLQYRVDRLGQAQAKARTTSSGYLGAMFPWESAASGAETCPTWAPFGALEVHISADVAFAAWQYYAMTGDGEWLREHGYGLVSEIANFYLSRVSVDEGGAYHLKGVIPPDEYRGKGVDDSIYTNFVVREALLFAAQAAERTGQLPNPRWRKVAHGLVLPYDAGRDAHPEFTGYDWQTKVKQADVVLLPYPLGMNMSKQTRVNDLDFYAQVTDSEGPAMTWGMHALGYLDAGEEAKAAANFLRSFANVQKPFDIWSETPAGGVANFITGAGGFLQTVIFGYFGVRILTDRLRLMPTLMPGARAMVLRGFWYRNRSLTVRRDQHHVQVALAPGGGGPARIADADGAGPVQLLHEGGLLSFASGCELLVEAAPPSGGALAPALAPARARPSPAAGALRQFAWLGGAGIPDQAAAARPLPQRLLPPSVYPACLAAAALLAVLPFGLARAQGACRKRADGAPKENAPGNAGRSPYAALAAQAPWARKRPARHDLKGP